MNKTLCNSIVESVAGNLRVVITAVALMLTCTNLAFAEEEPGTGGWTKDFSVAIGAKVWVNEWRTSIFDSNKVITELSKDTEPTPMPVASVRYKNFFVSSSYYPETEFEFNDFSQVVSVPVDFGGGLIFQLPGQQTTRTSAEREEWDVALGYFLVPYLAFTVGYKDIEQSFVDTVTLTNLPNQPPGSPTFIESPALTAASTTDISGPTLGLVGSAPIGNGFGVYGSFAYGFLETEFEGNSDDFDTPYVVVEGGVTYTHNMTHVPVYMPLSAATGFAGYRFQSYDTEDVTSFGEDGPDEAKGFVVGVNLTF